MNQHEVEILKRALAREKSARKQAEEILEKKSAELYYLNQQNKKAKDRLEALLKIKNSELKGFFENLVDPYIMMDLSGNVIKMNEAAERLIAYKQSDGLLNLMKLTLPEDADYISKSFKILAFSNKSFSLSEWYSSPLFTISRAVSELSFQYSR